MVISKLLYDGLPGSSRAGREPELAQRLANPLGASWVPQCHAHQPCQDTEVGSARIYVLDVWGLIVLTPCKSN